MLGYTEEELQRLTFADVTHPDDRARDVEAVKSLKEGRIQKHSAEKRYLRKNGAVVWGARTLTRIQGAEGSSFYALAMIEDINQRKQAEDTLRASEERYRTIMDQAADAIFMRDETGRILEANRKACQSLGYSREELLEKSVWDIDPEALQAGKQRLWGRILAGEQFTFESRQRRKDGSSFPVEATLGLVRLPAGPAVLGLVRDITERKRAEDALIESEKSLRETQRIARLGSYVLDIASGSWSSSGVLDTVFGIGGAYNHSVEGWAALVHPDDRAMMSDYFRNEVLAQGRAFDKEYRIIRHNDQAERWVHGFGKLEFDAEGHPLKMHGTIQDVTERRQAEEEIRQLNRTLEQRVKDRTAQLETANKELEAFSYSVSHDLRAPLRAIDGFARILEEDYTARLDDEGRRLLGIICGEAKRMGQLIDDLLSFSRMSRQQTESAQIDMTALAQAVFDEHAAQAPGRQLRLKLQPLPPARGDRALLRQALANLISNAIKYTRSRAVAEIEIGGRAEGGENLYHVKDNGVGFDMKYAGKLFGVFQRLHTADEFEGNGVGLALVQRVIHRHGGRVWGEGKLNEGSTFYFTLPIGKDRI
jgi:PAS domain S-box-containing protein